MPKMLDAQQLPSVLLVDCAHERSRLGVGALLGQLLENLKAATGGDFDETIAAPEAPDKMLFLYSTHGNTLLLCIYLSRKFPSFTWLACVSGLRIGGLFADFCDVYNACISCIITGR